MDTPEILYHYTDAKGLLGILDSKQIWATSYRFMTDAREFEYGFDLISELYPPAQESTLRFLAGADVETPNSSYAELIKAYKWHYESDCLFVAAFSASGDSLGQWRGYAGLHSGYSLGFRSEEMKSINEKTRLVACSYDKQEQLAKIDGLIRAVLPGMKHTFRKDIGQLLTIAVDAAKDIALQSTTLKHPAFIEEREWRFVVGPLEPNDKRICYRDSGRVIIPYVKIDFPTGLPLDHIKVGPGPHQVRNAGSLLQMLKLRGYNEVTVAPSEVPFRPW